MSAYIDDNPKTAFGSRKPDLSLVPPAAKIYMALAMQNGADKYGPYNWREKKVSVRTYIAAAMRHLESFLDGEDNDDGPKGSGFPHLGHAMASIGIVVDAIETGNAIDNRPKKGVAGVLIDRWTKPDPAVTSAGAMAQAMPQGPRNHETPKKVPTTPVRGTRRFK